MRVRLIAAHVDVTVAAAMIVHMTEQIALRVLADGHAEIGADAPKDQPDIVIAVVGRVQPAHHDETAAGANFLQPSRQLGGKMRQRKTAASDLPEAQTLRMDSSYRRPNISQVLLIKMDKPTGIVGEVTPEPSRWVSDRLRVNRSDIAFPIGVSPPAGSKVAKIGFPLFQHRAHSFRCIRVSENGSAELFFVLRHLIPAMAQIEIHRLADREQRVRRGAGDACGGV